MNVCNDTVVTGAALNAQNWANCTLIKGDLIVYRTDASVSESHLGFLSSVQLVFGNVIIEDNPNIFTLSFLRQLRHVRRLIIKNNPLLYYAVLPRLHSHVGQDAIYVDDCSALCPSKYPHPVLIDDTDCSAARILFQAHSSESLLASLQSAQVRVRCCVVF